MAVGKPVDFPSGRLRCESRHEPVPELAALQSTHYTPQGTVHRGFQAQA